MNTLNQVYYRIDTTKYSEMTQLLGDVHHLINRFKKLTQKTQDAPIAQIEEVSGASRKFGSMLDKYLSKSPNRSEQFTNDDPAARKKHLDEILPLNERDIVKTLETLVSTLVDVRHCATMELASPIKGFFAGPADIPAVIYEGFSEKLAISISSFLKHLDYQKNYGPGTVIEQDGGINAAQNDKTAFLRINPEQYANFKMAFYNLNLVIRHCKRAIGKQETQLNSLLDQLLNNNFEMTSYINRSLMVHPSSKMQAPQPPKTQVENRDFLAQIRSLDRAELFSELHTQLQIAKQSALALVTPIPLNKKLPGDIVADQYSNRYDAIHNTAQSIVVFLTPSTAQFSM